MLPEDRDRTDPRVTTGWPCDLSATFVLDTSAMSVRAVLAQVRRDVSRYACDDAAGSVELVLAEVLNNICEHAYLERDDGRIEISLHADVAGIAFDIRDYGLPMPSGRIPAGRQVAIDGMLDDMPEGGFGWNLIRRLTTGLHYERVGGMNRVRFTLPVPAAHR